MGNLRDWRRYHGVSQTDLSRASGVSQPHICTMEARGSGSRCTWERVAAGTARLRPSDPLSSGQIAGFVPYRPPPTDERHRAAGGLEKPGLESQISPIKDTEASRVSDAA